MKTYVNSTTDAHCIIGNIVGRVQDGTYLPFIDFDVETAPMPGLVGYPGSEKDENGNVIKASKKTYLTFVQRIWFANFNPQKLRDLQVYLPRKTTAGKEGEYTASEAWGACLSRILSLNSSAEGRLALENARWSVDEVISEQARLYREIDRGGVQCVALQKTIQKLVTDAYQEYFDLYQEAITLEERIHFVMGVLELVTDMQPEYVDLYQEAITLEERIHSVLGVLAEYTGFAFLDTRYYEHVKILENLQRNRESVIAQCVALQKTIQKLVTDAYQEYVALYQEAITLEKRIHFVMGGLELVTDVHQEYFDLYQEAITLEERIHSVLGVLAEYTGFAFLDTRYYEHVKILENLQRNRESVMARIGDINKNITLPRGYKTQLNTLKKQQVYVNELYGTYARLQNDVVPRIHESLDLRLCVHVLQVAVEGRIALDKRGSGTNVLDPVKPGLDPYTSTVFLVQVTLKESKSGEKHNYIFNTHKIDPHLLLPLLRCTTVTYTGANIKFDIKMAMHHMGLRTPLTAYCTRVASRMLYLGIRMEHSLAAVARRFLQYELKKEERDSFVGKRYAEPTKEQLAYAYTDTEILSDIRDAQLEKARQNGQEKLICDFSNLSWITAKWEYDGYPIDTEKWRAIAANAERQRDVIASELEEMLLPAHYRALVGTEVDVMPTDVNEFSEEGSAVDTRPNAIIRMSQTKVVCTLLTQLFQIGLDAPKDELIVQSLEETARGELERAYRLYHNGETHPFFQKYALWSKLSKQVSTYGTRFLWHIHPLTGKIHPSFHIAGTDTGRYSSTGPNFLNIPTAKEEGDPDFRGAFMADQGHYLLGADFATMELRIGGDISRDPMVRKMVERGADPHTFTATNMFHIVKDDVQEPVLRRDVYVRSTSTYDIDVWHIPNEWTIEQVADFALRPEVAEAVARVGKEYYVAITRKDAKSVTFLWLFRGSAYALAARTGLPLWHCKGLLEGFAGVYVVMDTYMQQLADTIHTNVIQGADGVKYTYATAYGNLRRYIALPTNPYWKDYVSRTDYEEAAYAYKRRLLGIQRELCNVPMQGGNAVITCEATLKLVASGHRSGVYPFLVIYDEIIATAPNGVPPQRVKALLEQSMLDAADTYMTYVPADAEADVKNAGTYWRKS